jgi:hypothetical protein
MIPDTAENEAHAPTEPSHIEDFFKKLEAQGKEWDAELARWADKARTASENAKADFHHWQREFHDKRAAAMKKVEALRTSKHDAWGEVKAGAEAAWTDLKSAFESAKKKFD